MKLRPVIFWPHLIAGVAAGVVILIMSFTGVVLTYERQLIAWSNSHLRSVPPAEARDFNWHNVIGVWSAVPLFIVVVTAVPISFRWANDAVYYAVGEQPPPARGGGGGREGGAARGGGREGGPRAEGRRAPVEQRAALQLDGLNAMWARAERQAPGWRTINLRLPATNSAPLVFAIGRGDGGQPHLRSTLTLERGSGRVVSSEDFSMLSTGRQIRNVMRFAHTGEVLGIPGQTIAGLVSLGGVVLAWTGLALALRRLSSCRGRRRARTVDTAQGQNATAA